MAINKKRIKSAYDGGDYHWLEIIEKEVVENKDTMENYVEIIKLLRILYKANYIMIEAETEDYAEKYYGMIYELYREMKIDLMKLIGYEEMWEEI